MSAPGPAEGIASRAERLAGELDALELDALLVDAELDVRYLTGFSGDSGAVLVVSAGVLGRGAQHVFLTDFRYQTQAAEQVPGSLRREIVKGELLEGVAAALDGRDGRLGFDEASITVKQQRRLAELLPAGWESVPVPGPLAAQRAVKDAGEQRRIRAASELADAALREVLEAGLVGRAERDVALELELAMRRLGAEGPSFPSIVASGAHGALPHAEPRAERIARDVLVTIDWGARLDGYCSDCTRTYATGESLGERARTTYELVLAAQLRGLQAVRAGVSGKQVDALARAVIEDAGEGEHFGHGLGHGVGLAVHEGPRLSRLGSDDPLLAGNVVTVEPGVYIPGELGVRIEDLVVLTDSGVDVLTGLDKQLTVIS
jgi:Xaa-Pro aminopeptidase